MHIAHLIHAHKSKYICYRSLLLLFFTDIYILVCSLAWGIPDEIILIAKIFLQPFLMNGPHFHCSISPIVTDCPRECIEGDAHHRGCDDRGRCCHAQCLGGCVKSGSPSECYACRNIYHNGECMDKCPTFDSYGEELLEVGLIFILSRKLMKNINKLLCKLLMSMFNLCKLLCSFLQYDTLMYRLLNLSGFKDHLPTSRYTRNSKAVMKVLFISCQLILQWNRHYSCQPASSADIL